MNRWITPFPLSWILEYRLNWRAFSVRARVKETPLRHFVSGLGAAGNAHGVPRPALWSQTGQPYWREVRFWRRSASEHARASIGEIAKMTGLSRNTLKEHFRRLVEKGYQAGRGTIDALCADVASFN
jgi:hypothetical protein